MNKSYHITQNVGTAKYVVSYHDGQQIHPDGSRFYGIRICKNKKDLRSFIKELKRSGYKEE